LNPSVDLEIMETTIPLFTLPKSGTHLIAKIFNTLNVDHITQHIFEPANCQLMVKPNVPGVILIRHPKAFFVSLTRWSDKRCAEGIEKSTTFPAYKDASLFAPWLNLSFEEKMTWLMTLDSRSPYPARLISDHLRWVTDHRNLHLYDFITYESIIGAEGGGSRSAQLDTLAHLLEKWGQPRTSDEIVEGVLKSWGNSATFDKGNAGYWQGVFTPTLHEVFRRSWGDLPRIWGYAD
jgi:hypothetical protein